MKFLKLFQVSNMLVGTYKNTFYLDNFIKNLDIISGQNFSIFNATKGNQKSLQIRKCSI